MHILTIVAKQTLLAGREGCYGSSNKSTDMTDALFE